MCYYRPRMRKGIKWLAVTGVRLKLEAGDTGDTDASTPLAICHSNHVMSLQS